MAQITYTDKVALNENPEIAAINKVSDDDMNEIKSVVNANYNNTIQITNTEPTDSDNKIWIDTGEIAQAHTEITNEYSTSTGIGYSANYVNNLFTYSTTEQRVGTWINGKPIYKKTFNFTVPAHTAATYQSISSYADNNILDVIYAEGVGYVGNHGCRILGQSVAPDGTERTRIFGNGTELAFQGSAFNDEMNCYATFYYTKTTD